MVLEALVVWLVVFSNLGIPHFILFFLILWSFKFKKNAFHSGLWGLLGGGIAGRALVRKA